MNLSFLEQLCDELLQSDNERSATLSAMSDAQLQKIYVDVLHQFGLELICGVDSHSHWMSDFLMIVANQGPIHACQTAFYAILCELDRRGVDRPDSEGGNAWRTPGQAR
jgi:hypothetical protein